MKKKTLLATLACAAAVAASLGTVGLAFAAEGSSAPADGNLFKLPGWDNVLVGDATVYDFKTDGVKNQTGHINGSVKVKKEANGNAYLEVGKDGANAFWWSGLSLEKAGDYEVSFKFKKAEGWTGNSAFAGFRFWSSSIAEGDIPWGVMTADVNGDTSGDWFTVTTTYTVSAAALPGTDSIQFGYDADASGVNFLMIDDVVVKYKPSVLLGEELFKLPGWNNVLSGDATVYDFKTEGVKNSTGHINGSVKVKKEADGNAYLEVGKDGANAFWWSGLTLPGAGDYQVSFKFKKAAGWTGNSAFAGFRFWSSSIADGDIPWGVMTADVNGDTSGEWFTVTKVYNVSAAALPGTDSIQFGYDADADGVNFLMIDDVSVKYIIPDESRPALAEGETGSATWNEATPADVEFGVDLKGNTIAKVYVKESEYELGSTEYSYNAQTGKLTIKSDAAKDLGEGTSEIVVETAAGDVSLLITVYLKTADIPATTEGYELKSTMLGGDFESYAIGLKFSDAQTEEAWGSLASYDDVGTIVDDGTGNHVLRLGRATGSTKMYSSAFCMTAPEISLGDIVTLKYSYKIVGDATKVAGTNSNTCFVGSSNTDYHGISYADKNAVTYEKNENEKSYPVKYTDGQNGWTNVEMSFVVDFAFLNSTNSLRFLFKVVEGVEIYFDNVELLRWVEEGAEDAEVPTVTATNAAYDGSSPADVTVTVDLKDYNISSLKVGSVNLTSANYALSDGDTKLTIKKEFLATLANGKHTVTITTLGGSCTFEITVTNATSGSGSTDTKPDKKKGCGSVIDVIAISSIATLAAAGAAAIARKGKKDEE